MFLFEKLFRRECLYTIRFNMMAMVEESAIEMGSTGSINAPGSVIVTNNMPDDLVEETEQER